MRIFLVLLVLCRCLASYKPINFAGLLYRIVNDVVVISPSESYSVGILVIKTTNVLLNTFGKAAVHDSNISRNYRSFLYHW